MSNEKHKLTDREIEVTRAMVAALAAYWCAPPDMVIKQLTGWLWTEAEAAALANAEDEPDAAGHILGVDVSMLVVTHPDCRRADNPDMVSTDEQNQNSNKMKTTARKETLAKIRVALGVKRLDPRRLFVVDDGAYTWIGDRADLTAKDARDLAAINARGCRPDRNGPETTESIDYDALCNRVSCLAASHNSAGVVSWDSLPQDWRDGSSLGEIAAL